MHDRVDVISTTTFRTNENTVLPNYCRPIAAAATAPHGYKPTGDNWRSRANHGCTYLAFILATSCGANPCSSGLRSSVWGGGVVSNAASSWVVMIRNGVFIIEQCYCTITTTFHPRILLSSRYETRQALTVTPIRRRLQPLSDIPSAYLGARSMHVGTCAS